MVSIGHRILLGILTVLLVAIVTTITLTEDVSATDVTMNITADDIWGETGSPWVIKADVTVKDGVTLNINPNATIAFNDYFFIDCEGTGKINAVGTSALPITFTSKQASPGSGDWNFINTGAGGVFKNCTFEYASEALIAGAGAEISDLFIEKTTFGLTARGDNTKIHGVTMSNLNLGMIVEGSSIVVTNCFAEKCQQAYQTTDTSSSSKFINCIYNGTGGVGFWIEGSNNLISQSRVYRANYGVQYAASGSNTFYACIIVSCSEAGFNFEALAQGAKLQRTRIYESNIGIRCYQAGGLEMWESTVKGNNLGFLVEDASPDSTLYHNNFIYNGRDVQTTNSNTAYDKDGEGNYWSKYGKADNNGDGIGDEPWYFSATQMDRFPLMSPIDFDKPIANAGYNMKEEQHKSFTLDGSLSEDDTWITNFTWTLALPENDLVVYDEKPSLKIDVAGIFTVTLKVTDPKGYTDTDTMSLTIIDDDAPEFISIETPDTVGAGEMLSIAAIIEDNVGVNQAWARYRFGPSGQILRLDLEKGASNRWSAMVSIPLGMHLKIFYRISANDTMNNIVNSQERQVAVKDITPPMIEPALIENVTTGDTSWLNVTVTDNRMVYKVTIEYWYPGGVHQVLNLTMMGALWAGQIDVPRDASSPLKVVFNANDTAGNFNVSNVIELEVIDNDTPVLNLDSSPHEYFRGESARFKVTLSDNIAIARAFVEVRYSGDINHVATAMWYDDGFYYGEVTMSTTDVRVYYRFRAEDSAGNVLVTDEQDQYLLSQRPKIITEPLKDAHEGEEYRMDFEADDPDSQKYELEWQMTTNGTWLGIDVVEGIISGTPSDLHIGWFWVNITVLDSDKVSHSIEFNITVHDVDTPPIVEITFPPDEQKVGNLLKISGRATDDQDNIVRVQVRIDRGVWMNATGTAVWTFETPVKKFKQGEHLVEVMAFDGVSESQVTDLVFIVPKRDDPDNGPGFGATLSVLALASALVLASWTGRRRR